MATTMKGLPPGHWSDPAKGKTNRCIDVDENGNRTHGEQCPTFRDHMEAEQEAMDRLPPERVWKTPVADGHAVYYVKSDKPLKLQHMPTGDAWQASPSLIRGLRLPEVRQQQERDARIRKLIADREAAQA